MNAPPEVLLAEYTVAQQNVNSRITRTWQDTAIVFAAALAGLAVTANADTTLARSIATTGAAVVFIAIIELWRQFYRMELRSLLGIWTRMREIERAVGMRLNIYINLLWGWEQRHSNPDWTAMMPEERNKLDVDYSAKVGRQPAWSERLLFVLWPFVLEAAWLGLVAWRWLDYKGVFA